MKKDKAKVIDEVWNEARVRSFLDCQPPPQANADAHCLLRAYQSMRADDFSLFLGFFTEAGRDLSATDAHGKTLQERIAHHRNSGEFRRALDAALARQASSG